MTGIYVERCSAEFLKQVKRGLHTCALFARYRVSVTYCGAVSTADKANPLHP